MSRQASAYAQAVAPTVPALYAINYLQESPYGYNGTLTPAKLPAAGYFDFCKRLPANYALYLGDTYTSGDSTGVVDAQRQRWIGSGALQCGQADLHLGSWLEKAKPATVPTRLGLAKACRRAPENYWLYCDPGMLTDPAVQTQVAGALT
jgi:hypothetical protein